MCGIAGLLARRPVPRDELLDTVRRMSRTLAHRGPDDGGAWVDAERGIALGHRRLAIVDPSPQGHQPMTSACGRYVLAFNGEIYNHVALRAGLGAQPWRGHSDTETVLALFTRHGVRATLALLVGMFAIAVWDQRDRALLLARDRMGEKPLYWGRLPAGDLVFGSELKALRAHPGWEGEIDRDAVALYMRHSAVPAPYSVFRGIGKLRPGEWLSATRDGAVRIERWWDVVAVARAGRAATPALDDTTAIETLDALLGQAVRGQMMADVPLGAFLSGGVDSSLIVSTMCRYADRPVRTFTIGFRETAFNEARFAKAVAAHLGTEHTELTVTAQDALAVIPQLPRIYDEPFADASQIPTFLVSRLARQHVTVALSGDGGDELFAGYDRYMLADRVWPRLQRLPLALRRLAARAIVNVPSTAWTSIAGVLPATRRLGNVGAKLHRFAHSVMPARSRGEMYHSLMSHWHEAVVLGAREAEPASQLRRDDLADLSDLEFMSLLDQLGYLPDGILVKVDRAAMAVSLETRAPLLDHRLVEFAWRTPMHQKRRHGKSKWLLRELLYRHVPRALIERPKQGFNVPLDDWLRGPLRKWAAELLDPELLRRQGLFDVAEVQRRWKQHLGGTRSWQTQLWDVLMFQAWLLETTTQAASAFGG